MSDSDDDDIIAEGVLPIPPNVLYPGHHGVDLHIRHHRPKYSTVEIGRGEPAIDPDDIPDDSRNPERLAALHERSPLHEQVENLVDALTPRERSILERRFGAKPGASPRELEKAAFAKLNGDSQENDS
jgi:hypothetical protein